MAKFVCYMIGAIIAGIVLYHFKMIEDIPSSITNAFAIIALYRTCKNDDE